MTTVLPQRARAANPLPFVEFFSEELELLGMFVIAKILVKGPHFPIDLDFLAELLAFGNVLPAVETGFFEH